MDPHKWLNSNTLHIHHSALRVTQTTDFNLKLTCRDEQYLWYVYLKYIIEIQKYFVQKTNLSTITLSVFGFSKYIKYVVPVSLFIRLLHSWYNLYIYISGGPLSALTCCVNVRLLSAIKKISPLIYSQSWVGSWVYSTQAMITFTLIF